MQLFIASYLWIMYTKNMKKVEGVENIYIPQYLEDKRNEIMWSLSEQQEYNFADIQKMFNFKHLSTVTRIIKRKPQWWVSPWVKRDN